jgi:hypothetical protein
VTLAHLNRLGGRTLHCRHLEFEQLAPGCAAISRIEKLCERAGGKDQ